MSGAGRGPGVAASVVVGLAAAAYLFTGGVLVLAYGTARGWDGLHVEWGRLPVMALFLVPGVVLGVSAVFLRWHRWAVVTAGVLMVGGIPLALPRLVFYVIVMWRLGRVGWFGLVYLGMYGGGLALLIAGIALVGRQWVMLRRRPEARAAGAGFELA